MRLCASTHVKNREQKPITLVHAGSGSEGVSLVRLCFAERIHTRQTPLQAKKCLTTTGGLLLPLVCLFCFFPLACGQPARLRAKGHSLFFSSDQVGCPVLDMGSGDTINFLRRQFANEASSFITAVFLLWAFFNCRPLPNVKKKLMFARTLQCSCPSHLD